MKSNTIQIFFLLLFLKINLVSIGQKLEFEHLSDKDGISNNTITAIVKDSYGFMWFGTFNGLSKYDGYKFTNYFTDARNNTSIPDNQIRVLLQSGEGKLFVGFYYAGICIYDREKDNFIRYKHNPGDPNSLINDYVLTMYEDKRGIWIGTRGGLDKFDPKTKKFTHYSPPGEDHFFVAAIDKDDQGNLWLYGSRQRIFKFNPEKNTYETISLVNDFNYDNSSSWGSEIKYDIKGNLWVGTEGYGVMRYNTKTGDKNWYCVKNGKLRSDIIYSIIEDSQKKIWIGTDGGGAYRYSYETDSLERLEHNPYSPGSLSNNAIYCIYESQPGTIWIGTFASGVNIHTKERNKFSKYSALGTPGECLSQESVLSISEAGNGKIWLGTDGGGLNLFDPRNQKFKYYTTQNSIIHSDIIKSMYVDKENNLWLGSFGKGLCKVNFEKGEIKKFRGDIHSKGETILGDHVWAINESNDNKIWLGLISYGVNVYDPEKKAFSYYPFDTLAYSKGVANTNVIFEDSRKRIWIGMETAGAGYFDPLTKRFVKFAKEEGVNGTLSSNNVRDIFEDSRGNIWIATFEGGLNKLINQEKKQFENYTVKDGLATDNIQSILEDDHHNLWLGTDKGISAFRIAEKKFINFDTDDGLSSREFNTNAALRTGNGYMYFGGTQGLTIFHPDSIRFNLTPPAVTITDFKIFNNSLLPNQYYNGRIYLEKSIEMSEEIILKHQDYLFSIEFSALDFAAPNKNKFAYRLKGFNDKWYYVNADKRFATYTNLDPGEYIFQVIACNNDRVWNTKGTSLKIIVLPPWWMTWWFRISIGALIISGAAAFYYVRLRTIKQRNKFLEQEVQKRTAEIRVQQEEILKQKNELEQLNRTKDKFFSIIGHDLKGPVRALASLTSLLKEDSDLLPEKHKLLTQHIDTASMRIQSLVLSLFEWARTQSQQIKTVPVPVSAEKIFKENIEVLSAQASQKQIQLKIESKEAHIFFADYNMILTVVRNILGNAIKYTPKGGVITLSSTTMSDGKIKLAIADNGIGMSEEKLNNLFLLGDKTSVKGTDNETGTGLGLVISKEFVEINKGKIYAESTIGKGSTFYIILPAHVALKP